MDNDAQKNTVLQAAEVSDDGKRRLPCAAAFALSRRLGIPLASIGEVCDELDIRITRCQLGCFR